MLSDILMIIVTAFAIFGMFCFVEQIILAIKYSDLPKTVTIIKYDDSPAIYNTIHYIHNSLYNNEILILSENNEDDCPAVTTISLDELSQYITNALFTKPLN